MALKQFTGRKTETADGMQVRLAANVGEMCIRDRKYISSAIAYGWIGGYKDGTFRPDSPILRCEAAKLMKDVYKRQGLSV